MCVRRVPSPMGPLELSAICRTIVDDVNGVTEDDEVIVVTDTARLSIAEAITAACRATGARTVLQVMPRTEEHGHEAPPTVIAGMRAADFVFTVTTHSVTHTDGFREAVEHGTKLPVLRGVTEDMFIEGGINTDYEQLKERTLAVRAVLAAADEAVVTSRAGTDVTMSLEGRDAISLDGYCHEYNNYIGSYPPGESPTSPVEGTTEGTIVIDYSMDSVGRLDEPIELTVSDGVVRDIAGGDGAEQLEAIVAAADEHAGNIAEFAIGTNPDARLVANLAEDKKRLGTVHFAIGDNRTLGGTVRSDIHLDGLVRWPTVELDGTVVLDDGTLELDVIRALAADQGD